MKSAGGSLLRVFSVTARKQVDFKVGDEAERDMYIIGKTQDDHLGG